MFGQAVLTQHFYWTTPEQPAFHCDYFPNKFDVVRALVTPAAYELVSSPPTLMYPHPVGVWFEVWSMVLGLLSCCCATAARLSASSTHYPKVCDCAVVVWAFSIDSLQLGALLFRRRRILRMDD